MAWWDGTHLSTSLAQIGLTWLLHTQLQMVNYCSCVVSYNQQLLHGQTDTWYSAFQRGDIGYVRDLRAHLQYIRRKKLVGSLLKFVHVGWRGSSPPSRLLVPLRLCKILRSGLPKRRSFTSLDAFSPSLRSIWSIAFERLAAAVSSALRPQPIFSGSPIDGSFSFRPY